MNEKQAQVILDLVGETLPVPIYVRIDKVVVSPSLGEPGWVRVHYRAGMTEAEATAPSVCGTIKMAPTELVMNPVTVLTTRVRSEAAAQLVLSAALGPLVEGKEWLLAFADSLDKEPHKATRRGTVAAMIRRGLGVE